MLKPDMDVSGLPSRRSDSSVNNNTALILDMAREAFSLDGPHGKPDDITFAAELADALDTLHWIQRFFPRIKGERLASWLDRVGTRLWALETQDQEMRCPLWLGSISPSSGPLPHPSEVPGHQIAILDEKGWFLLSPGIMGEWESDYDAKTVFEFKHWMLLPPKTPSPPSGG